MFKSVQSRFAASTVAASLLMWLLVLVAASPITPVSVVAAAAATPLGPFSSSSSPSFLSSPSSTRTKTTSSSSSASTPSGLAHLSRDTRTHHCIHDEVQQTVFAAVAAAQKQKSVQQQQQQHQPYAVAHPLSTRQISTSGLPIVSINQGAVSTTTTTARLSATASASTTSGTTVTWGTLRVLVSALDLTNSSSYCTTSKTYVANKQGGYVACTSADTFTDAKRAILQDYLLPQALQMHTDRLQVQQTAGTWKVTDMSGVCANFQVPAEHTTVGVTGVDFIVYVSSVPVQSGVMAWATTCQVHADGRPAVGVINIAPANVLSRYDQYMIHIVTHELAHALGFDSNFFSSAGMSGTVTGIRGKTYAAPVITSTSVVAAAQRQYKCSTATYMELEDLGTSGTVGSHWKMRNAISELMAPASGAGYYTNLTLAAFADTGFYKPDYSKAEEMPWAEDIGCDFLSQKCMTGGVTPWPEMFCPQDETGFRCTAGRLSLGACALQTYASLPTYFQYFANARVGGYTNYMDYCPFVLPWDFGKCAQPSSGAATYVQGFNVFSDAARCFDGDFTPKVTNSQIQFYKGLCAGVVCDAAAASYTVTVYDSDVQVACPPGTNISLSLLSDAFEAGGYITCPSYLEVCQSNVKAALEYAEVHNNTSSSSSSSKSGSGSGHGSPGSGSRSRSRSSESSWNSSRESSSAAPFLSSSSSASSPAAPSNSHDSHTSTTSSFESSSSSHHNTSGSSDSHSRPMSKDADSGSKSMSSGSSSGAPPSPAQPSQPTESSSSSSSSSSESNSAHHRGGDEAAHVSTKCTLAVLVVCFTIGMVLG